MQVGYRRSRHEPCMAPRLPSLQHSDAWHLWLASASRLPKDPYVPPLGWSSVFCQEAECWSKWMPPRWVLQNPPENLNEESANGPRMWSHNTFQHETSKVAIEPSPPSAAHPAHQLGVAIDGWPEWYTPSRDSLQDRPIGKRSSKVSPVNIGCKECTRSCLKVDIFIYWNILWFDIWAGLLHENYTNRLKTPVLLPKSLLHSPLLSMRTQEYHCFFPSAWHCMDLNVPSLQVLTWAKTRGQ